MELKIDEYERITSLSRTLLEKISRVGDEPEAIARAKTVELVGVGASAEAAALVARFWRGLGIPAFATDASDAPHGCGIGIPGSDLLVTVSVSGSRAKSALWDHVTRWRRARGADARVMHFSWYDGESEKNATRLTRSTEVAGLIAFLGLVGEIAGGIRTPDVAGYAAEAHPAGVFGFALRLSAGRAVDWQRKENTSE